MIKAKKKNLVIVMAFCCMLAVGGALAYFTAGESATNTFTVGKIAIELTEPSWDPYDPPTDITPNEPFDKDPQVTNTGNNDAFVFVRVTIPKAAIKTADLNGNQAAAGAVTELFQLNKIKSDKTGTTQSAVQWTGRAVENADSYDQNNWHLIKTATSAAQAGDVGVAEDELDLTNNNVYIFAYAKTATGSTTNYECTPLAKNATTQPLFQSVTFCNAIESQGLEECTLNIKVDAFAIQTNDLLQKNATDPSEVWTILNAQNPVETASEMDANEYGKE